ncbi:MAG: outer membrane beta-barrel protein [Selenomonadales bacterium]|nr:outer membrane beta-barrel protein [Selenomonadales bacterium]
MKKKVLSALIATMVVGSVTAMAAPAEIEEGKWDVTLGTSFSPNSEYEGRDLDGDSGFYGNITYGMDDNWAIQYDYSHYSYSLRDEEGKGDASEVNILYKLSPNLNAYAGYVYYGEKYTYAGGSDGYHTDGIQVGLQGWYPLGEKVNLFGKIGIGNNNQIYEIGSTYKFADDWGLDVSYRWAEYKDFNDEDDGDYKFDGVRAGISTTF